MDPFVKECVISIVKWMIGPIITFFVAKGALTDNQGETLGVVLSAMLIGYGVQLSSMLYARYKSRQKLVTALANPVPKTENEIERQISSGQSAPVTTQKTEVPKV